MSEDDMFSRWSARRAKVAREEAAERPAPVEPPEPPAPETPEEEDALLARLGLPRPEDVTGAEVRKFLARGVPEVFRRRALRALWRSDPTFAVLDGLNDYDEDFTLPQFNQKVLATAYQVGKGIIREIEKAAPTDEAERAAADGEAEVDAPPAPDATALDAPAIAAPIEVATTDEPQDEIPARAFVPKRMSFDT